MRTFITLLLLTISTAVAADETAYITDQVEINLRSGQGNWFKSLKLLTPGMELTVLKNFPASGYSQVRTADGTTGYILTRLLQKERGTPASVAQQYEQKIAQLESESAKQKAELETLKSDQALQILSSDRDKLRMDLDAIKQTASNAIQLEQQRNQLQERVVTAERELQQLKRENLALSDSSKQDWFLYGGLVAFTGIILGIILPKLSRSRRSSWDTF